MQLNLACHAFNTCGSYFYASIFLPVLSNPLERIRASDARPCNTALQALDRYLQVSEVSVPPPTKEHKSSIFTCLLWIFQILEDYLTELPSGYILVLNRRSVESKFTWTRGSWTVEFTGIIIFSISQKAQWKVLAESILYNRISKRQRT